MTPEPFEDAARRVALEHGYDLAGFASLRIPDGDRENLRAFVDAGRHGSMTWFERHLHLREDPAQLFPGAATALVLAVYYRDQEHERALSSAKVKLARYAGGRDYHKVLRKKGTRLLAALQELDGDLDGRIVVDSAPVPEKVLAREAGLGWQGKHTNLIHPELGSYFFLSVLLLNRRCSPGVPVNDLCGSCTLCIDACPTDALTPYRMDARRCISYVTIESATGSPGEDEHLGPENAARSPDFENWAFGCDICQEVCPYNRNRRARDLQTQERAFVLRAETARLMRDAELNHADEWEALSRGSAFRRVKLEQWKRNIEYARAKHAE